MNFTIPSWIEHGKRSGPDCCKKYPNVFGKEEMNFFVQHYQPELFPLWKQGLDLKPDPCAPQDQKMEFMNYATFELGIPIIETST